MFLDSGKCFGFWDVFLDSGKCFGFWEVFLDSGTCFGFWDVFLDSGTCFGFWEVFCPYETRYKHYPDQGSNTCDCIDLYSALVLHIIIL